MEKIGPGSSLPTKLHFMWCNDMDSFPSSNENIYTCWVEFLMLRAYGPLRIDWSHTMRHGRLKDSLRECSFIFAASLIAQCICYPIHKMRLKILIIALITVWFDEIAMNNTLESFFFCRNSLPFNSFRLGELIVKTI